ncbi:DnaJ C-terminal domain-containing protein [Roseomonas gilardii]|uniref:DnaJ C-terminal domain-containing protein n=1 Tax=Roseomonas gilardii TaxID=257708 RepID=UPI0004891528|nr:J domain-containing protein [Roseomonas gilardii]SUE45061.1 Curved DNA-binding protein [Roseomonas gilardii subsp. rosea]
MAQDDPYSTLGVSRQASADEIRKAFRAIAKKNHPDLNPGDTVAEERFKAANAAHDLLSDPEKRARFDRGEIDATGQEVPPRQYWRDYADAPGAGRYRGGAGAGAGREGFGASFGAGQGFGTGDFEGQIDPEDLGDIFGQFFRQRGAESGGTSRPRKGQDSRYHLEVPFLDVVNGATQRLTLPEGGTLDVRIPPGLEDGQVLRLRGKGQPGRNGGPDGDALIEIAVQPHPFYRRQGRDLEMEVPVTFAEAILGGRIAVPTPRGEVTLTVPPRSDAGTRLRLRGRGVAEHGGQPAGDLYATLRIVLGPVDDRIEEFLRGWAKEGSGDDARQEMRRQA